MYRRLFPGVTVIILATALFQMTVAADETKPADVFQMVAESEDVEWLEGIAASLDRARELDPKGGLGRGARNLRTAAFARLGELGTPEALKAVGRIEEAAKEKIPAPEYCDPFSPHPAWHFGDGEGKFLVTVEAETAVTYTVFRDTLLGIDDGYYFTWRQTEQAEGLWHRPVYTILWQRPMDNRLVFNENEDDLLLDLAYKIPVGKALADDDHDGWTNWEEQMMNLREESPDTDGDGIPDGKDVCPDYAATEEDEKDEEVGIIQKAFFATFGLSDSRHLLIVGEDSRKAQLWGYGGPVLYRPGRKGWMASHGPGAVFVGWEITKKTDSQVTVSIHDWEGTEAGGSQEVFLEKTDGEWFVVGRKFGPVS